MFKKRKKVVAAQVVDIVGSEKPDYFRMAVANQASRQLLGISGNNELSGAMLHGAFSMQKRAYNFASKYFPESFSSTWLVSSNFSKNQEIKDACSIVVGCNANDVIGITYTEASIEVLGNNWIEEHFPPKDFTYVANYETNEDSSDVFYGIYKNNADVVIPVTGKEVEYTDDDFKKDKLEDLSWERPDVAIKLNIYTDLHYKENSAALRIGFKKDNQTKEYIYILGSGGNFFLDNYNYKEKADSSLFWPIIPVKEDKHYYSDGLEGRHKYKDKEEGKTKEDKRTFPVYRSDVFEKANAYFKRMTGDKNNNLRSFNVALDASGDSDKTKWGYICSAIDIGTKSDAGMAYVYNFFKRMYEFSIGNSIQFTSPINPNRYHYEHKWGSIQTNSVLVSAMPSQIQTYIKKHRFITNFTLKRLGYEIPKEFDLGKFVVGKLEKNKIKLYIISNLEYNVYVVSGKWAKKSWSNYIKDINNAANIVIIPMHIEILNELSLKFKNQLCAENQFLVLTTSKTKKVWRGFFKIMIQAIGIVIGSLLGGMFGGAAFGALASGFLGGAVGGIVGGGIFGALLSSLVNAIALVIITNTLTNLTGLRGMAKQMVGFLIGVLAWPTITSTTLVGGTQALINPNMYLFTAKNLLDFGFNLAQGILNGKFVSAKVSYQKKLEEGRSDYENKMAELEAKKEELGFNGMHVTAVPTPEQVLDNRCLTIQDFVKLDLDKRTNVELNYGKL